MDSDSHSASTYTASPPIGSHTRRQLINIIWNLAWPVIVTLLLESLVGLVDTLMVGRLGSQAVAAVGVGAQVLSSVSIAMTAVGTGTLALVARHIGAREPADANRVLGQAIVTAWVLSVVLILPVIVYARPIVGWFGVDPAVADLGAGFVRIVMLSIPQSATMFVIASGLRGAGDTRTPLVIGITVNIVNVIGNYTLIFGHFGFPAMGVRGSATATTLAFLIGMLMGLAFLWSGRLKLQLRRRDVTFHWSTVKRVLGIGYPAAVEQIFMQIGFFLYLKFAANYGTSAVAAYFIGVRILALSFLPGFGFAAAAAGLVGQNLGARQPALAARAGWEANRLSIYFMSFLGLLVIAMARPIAAAFVDDATVIQDTVWFIYALGAAQPFMAADATLGGALRGAGDTRFPLVAVFVGFYGCRLACAYLATFVFELSLAWVWAALIGDYIARALLKAWRFRGGKWMHIRV